MKTFTFLFAFATLLFFTSCNAPNTEVKWETMTFNQSKPILVDVNDGDENREHGERMFFEAKMNDVNGKEVARLIGMHDIADLPGEDGIGNSTVEERFTKMSIVFSEGDEIVVSGANIYPVDQRIMQAGIPQVRAIGGGTGKYKGIRGQVTTTRKDDETYTHLLEYRLD